MGFKQVAEVWTFQHAPVPTSMFEDSGNMRNAGGKSELKASMGVKSSHRLFETTSIILDGCAILYSVHSEQVADYVINSKKYLNGRLDKNVYLIFDRYF